MRKLIAAILPILLLLAFSGCAARGNKNLSPTTTWEVNTASLLSTLQDQYKGFYTDVGTAQHSGALTASQVSTLNGAGGPWKTSLETANQLFKQYETTHDDTLKVKVVGLIAEAEQIALTLTTQKQSMGGAR